MDGQEQIERRENYKERRNRMEDKILDKLMDLGERISSMESTLQAQVETIKKYNNVVPRVTSLEEYRERCNEERGRRRFPTMAVIGSVIGALIMALINKFAIK